MSLVRVVDLYKSYHLGGTELPIIRGLNFEMTEGETVAVIGPSGIGKSTLLYLIGTLDRPDSGQISIGGTDIASLEEKELAEFRALQIGFVFQFHHLLPEFTAVENVLLAGMIKGNGNDPKPRATELLDRVGLGSRSKHKPGELSGGEQQRVALARALQNNPPLILADEPTGNLDRNTAMELQDLIFELAKEERSTFLIVTHDRQFAQRCDRILMLKDGRVVPTTADNMK